jgi:hypothetical protein
MKNLILAGITVLILGFHSCGDRYVTEEIVPLTYTGDFKIYPDKWEQGEDMTGTYYYCEIREPELTQDVLEYGIMQAFYCYTLPDDNTERYALLPYEDYWANHYTEYFTVEFSQGFITFLYKTNEATISPPENPYDFRVRFLW